jgi:hypothetical protein
VGDHGRIALRVAGTDRAVALQAHRVAGGVQGLGADDDRVEPEVVLLGVPVAVVDAPEQAEQLERVEATAPRNAVLAVGREDEVLRTERPPGADLRGLLTEQLGPDAELAVALERGRLRVDPAHHDHVSVEAAQLVRGELHVELRVVDPLALRRQQLDQLGPAVALRGTEDLGQVGPERRGLTVKIRRVHVCSSFAVTALRGLRAPVSWSGRGPVTAPRGWCGL